MSLIPLDDLVHLEEIAPTETTTIHLLSRDPNEKKRAKVISTGPGILSSSGVRVPLDVSPGDEVIAHAGAGFKFPHDGKERWFVYGSRGDIIAKVRS